MALMLACSAADILANAGDGLGGGVRVQRGEHQVPRFGGLHPGEDALTVADFADEDHVGILAHGIADTVGERFRVDADFALLELGEFIVEQVLDRVFNSDNAHRLGGVDLLEEGADRCALALAGGTGEQHQAARKLEDIAESLREAQIPQPEVVLGTMRNEQDCRPCCLLQLTRQRISSICTLRSICRLCSIRSHTGAGKPSRNATPRSSKPAEGMSSPSNTLR